MKKTVFLLTFAALFIFAGCNLKETEVYTSDSDDGGDTPTAAAAYAGELRQYNSDEDAVILDGNVITIQKNIELTSKLSTGIPSNVTLYIGGPDRHVSQNRVADTQLESVTLTLADGIDFDVGDGRLVINGKLEGTNRLFEIETGKIHLYGTLALGSKGINVSGTDEKEGELLIYPGALLKDFDLDGTERELIGSNSVLIGPGALLKMKGKFGNGTGVDTNYDRTREFTLSGSAVVEKEMAIFNNSVGNENGKWQETITLEDGTITLSENGVLIIAGTGGVTAENYMSILNNYIKVSNEKGGTIASSGGSLLFNDTPVMWGGTTIVWGGAEWMNVPNADKSAEELSADKAETTGNDQSN
ncbi:MAG: hypothetical protein LBH18_07340 [Spirochaetaceae bacterium]|jgi:hypothetical protein|nr:hypothetical protein [Spirochaetaceae bacterium]